MISYKGVPFKMWNDLFAVVSDAPVKRMHSSLNGVVLRAGQNYPYLIFEGEAAIIMRPLLAGGEERIHIKACYCSVFDDCHLYDSGGTTGERARTPVARCPDYAEASFQD